MSALTTHEIAILAYALGLYRGAVMRGTAPAPAGGVEQLDGLTGKLVADAANFDEVLEHMRKLAATPRGGG